MLNGVSFLTEKYPLPYYVYILFLPSKIPREWIV
jgi:hypothetical protein